MINWWIHQWKLILCVVKFFKRCRKQVSYLYHYDIIQISFMLCLSPQIPVNHIFNFPTLPPSYWQSLASLPVFMVLSYSIMSYSCHHTAFSDWLLSCTMMHIHQCFFLIAHFFLSLNNFPLYQCSTVCLCIHLLRVIWLFLDFGNYE